MADSHEINITDDLQNYYKLLEVQRVTLVRMGNHTEIISVDRLNPTEAVLTGLDSQFPIDELL